MIAADVSVGRGTPLSNSDKGRFRFQCMCSCYACPALAAEDDRFRHKFRIILPHPLDLAILGASCATDSARLVNAQTFVNAQTVDCGGRLGRVEVVEAVNRLRRKNYETLSMDHWASSSYPA